MPPLFLTRELLSFYRSATLVDYFALLYPNLPLYHSPDPMQNYPPPPPIDLQLSLDLSPFLEAPPCFSLMTFPCTPVFVHPCFTSLSLTFLSVGATSSEGTNKPAMLRICIRRKRLPTFGLRKETASLLHLKDAFFFLTGQNSMRGLFPPACRCIYCLTS